MIADYSPSSKTPPTYYQKSFPHHPDTRSIPSAGIVNRPNPNHVSFLYENPRFVNEPICFANTKVVQEKQPQWWPEKIPDESKLQPKYGRLTTNRLDYHSIEQRPPPLTRFGCTPNRLVPRTCIVPLLGDKQPSKMKERVSFEHQFDCRRDRTERGKLRGSFVWEPTVH